MVIKNLRVTKEKQEVIDKMKKSLGIKVSDVIASSRLVDSAACLVLSKDEPGASVKKNIGSFWAKFWRFQTCL